MLFIITDQQRWDATSCAGNTVLKTPHIDKLAAFVTPPGWWHSHQNESDEDAIVLPVQDAGLQTYMQTLDIQFAHGY